MGVAVLSPQDVLKDPFSKQNRISSHMKYPRNSNPNPNRSNRTQPNRRRRSPPRSNSTSPPSKTMVVPTLPAKNLVMGQVKILKRGQEIPETSPDLAPETVKSGNEVSDLGSTDRLGPDPVLIPTQIRLTESNRAAGFYAGSAFITSPPPSSLPLPAFFMKKSVTMKQDDATTDLRRILRLDL